MEEYNMKCRKCDKWFKVIVTTMGFPGGKEKEEIICPYCREENGYEMTDGFVHTEIIKSQSQNND